MGGGSKSGGKGGWAGSRGVIKTIAPPRSTPYIRPKAEGGDVDDEDVRRMVYVGNLPKAIEWQELKDHMKQVGDVQFASLLANDNGSSRGVGFVRYATEDEALEAIAILNGTELQGRSLTVDPWTGAIPRTKKGGLAVGGGGGSSKGIGKGGNRGEGKNVGKSAGGKSGGKGKEMDKMWNMFLKWMDTKGKGGASQRQRGSSNVNEAKVNGDPSQMVYVGNIAPGVEWQELKDHMKQVGDVEFVSVRGRMGQVRFATAEEATQAILTLNGSELMGKAIVVDEWTTTKGNS